ncbi:hypothetical protein [Saccharothrix sp. ST-888]|uniref:hypothetical protein n=1 Tax=Saccharothrix sp. ST-888 TaxID=1427391 RepID=UPI0005EBF465|nr:hypothetical protein [Saccharothrix sp. ST-888]KJK58891.1 hypothetical protein UK12_07220 [Saccharothrix sp. ST-888]
MFLLGLLLLAVTGVFAALLIAQNLDAGSDYSVMLFNNHIATMNALEIFLAGIALTLLFALGWLLASSGVRQHRRRAVARRAGKRAVAAAGRGPTGDPELDAALRDTEGGQSPPAARRHHFGHRFGH